MTTSRTPATTRAGSWEGETASSYQNVAGDILKANDKHEERVKRAATALDQYSARLQRCINDMTAIRGRATTAGSPSPAP